MNTAKKMQKICEEIAKANNVDLYQAETHIRITNDPYLPLVIENLGFNRISVTHYSEMNGDLMRDCDMEFYILNGEWVPYYYRQDGFREENSITFSGYYESPKLIYRNLQAAHARFANYWAGNLRQQGFLKVSKTEGKKNAKLQAERDRIARLCAELEWLDFMRYN